MPVRALATGREEPGRREPKEVMHHGLKLVDREMQLWALSLWFVALPSVLYGVRRAPSCVKFSDEQATAPTMCAGLVGDATKLRLPDFCWHPCAEWLSMSTLLATGVGVLVQALVVVMNREDCSSCFRLRGYFDPTDLLGTPNQGGGLSIAHPIRSLRAATRRRLIGKADASLAPGPWMSKLSALCALNAALQLTCFVLLHFSHSNVFFECNRKGGGKIREEPRHVHNWYHMGALIVSGFLLCLVIRLAGTAEWTFQAILHFEGIDDFTKQFNKVEQVDGTSKFFPVQKNDGDPHDVLKSVFLMELVWVEQDGEHYRPGDAGSISHMDREVTLHFKMVIVKTQESLYRKRAMQGLILAALLVGYASKSCWVCVGGIRAQWMTTASELRQQLLLMGACGRQRSTGEPTLLACWALLLACFQEGVVMAVGNAARKQGGCQELMHGQGSLETGDAAQSVGEEEVPPEQLSLKLVDMRRTVGLNPQSYRKAGVETLPTVPCHIWVQLTDNGEKAVDCSDRGSDSSQRSQWVRSREPRQVAIFEEKNTNTLRSWARGLAREEFNLPAQCIKFKEGKQEMRQVVPPEFMAGSLHTWVDLGPKAAWETFSMALVLTAILLIIFDVAAFSLHSDDRILTSCREVLNRECVHIQGGSKSGQPIEFRISVGPVAAVVGAVSALYGVLGVRVAQDSCGILLDETMAGWKYRYCSCLCLYLEAACKGTRGLVVLVARLVAQLVCFACDAFGRSCCCCCPCIRKRRAIKRAGARPLALE